MTSFFPELFTSQESAELPAEEFFQIDEGDDLGWPYCYYDWQEKAKSGRSTTIFREELGGKSEK